MSLHQHFRSQRLQTQLTFLPTLHHKSRHPHPSYSMVIRLHLSHLKMRTSSLPRRVKAFTSTMALRHRRQVATLTSFQTLHISLSIIMQINLGSMNHFETCYDAFGDHMKQAYADITSVSCASHHRDIRLYVSHLPVRICGIASLCFPVIHLCF